LFLAEITNHKIQITSHEGQSALRSALSNIHKLQNTNHKTHPDSFQRFSNDNLFLCNSY